MRMDGGFTDLYNENAKYFYPLHRRSHSSSGGVAVAVVRSEGGGGGGTWDRPSLSRVNAFQSVCAFVQSDSECEKPNR